jgi:hypothetical protein
MPVLYRKFLEDFEQYKEVENFWQEAWNEIKSDKKSSDEWETPWFKNTFADGTPCQDGNPIFSAVSSKIGKAIRIIQLNPEMNNNKSFGWWLDTFGDENITGGPIKELVVACVLNTENCEKAKVIMRDWLESKRRFAPSDKRAQPIQQRSKRETPGTNAVAG